MCVARYTFACPSWLPSLCDGWHPTQQSHTQLKEGAAAETKPADGRAQGERRAQEEVQDGGRGSTRRACRQTSTAANTKAVGAVAVVGKGVSLRSDNAQDALAVKAEGAAASTSDRRSRRASKGADAAQDGTGAAAEEEIARKEEDKDAGDLASGAGHAVDASSGASKNKRHLPRHAAASKDTVVEDKDQPVEGGGDEAAKSEGRQQKDTDLTGLAAGGGKESKESKESTSKPSTPAKQASRTSLRKRTSTSRYEDGGADASAESSTTTTVPGDLPSANDAAGTVEASDVVPSTTEDAKAGESASVEPPELENTVGARRGARRQLASAAAAAIEGGASDSTGAGGATSKASKRKGSRVSAGGSQEALADEDGDTGDTKIAERVGLHPPKSLAVAEDDKDGESAKVADVDEGTGSTEDATRVQQRKGKRKRGAREEREDDAAAAPDQKETKDKKTDTGSDAPASGPEAQEDAAAGRSGEMREDGCNSVDGGGGEAPEQSVGGEATDKEAGDVYDDPRSHKRARKRSAGGGAGVASASQDESGAAGGGKSGVATASGGKGKGGGEGDGSGVLQEDDVEDKAAKSAEAEEREQTAKTSKDSDSMGEEGDEEVDVGDSGDGDDDDDGSDGGGGPGGGDRAKKRKRSEDEDSQRARRSAGVEGRDGEDVEAGVMPERDPNRPLPNWATNPGSDEITDEEKRAVPEFFCGRPIKTPERSRRVYGERVHLLARARAVVAAVVMQTTFAVSSTATRVVYTWVTCTCGTGTLVSASTCSSCGKSRSRATSKRAAVFKSRATSMPSAACTCTWRPLASLTRAIIINLKVCLCFCNSGCGCVLCPCASVCVRGAHCRVHYRRYMLRRAATRLALPQRRLRRNPSLHCQPTSVPLSSRDRAVFVLCTRTLFRACLHAGVVCWLLVRSGLDPAERARRRQWGERRQGRIA
jgi:hypothetical protein